MKRSPLKRGTSQMKRTPLRKRSKSETAKCKERIQSLLRDIVMIRDGGCILRSKRACGAILGASGHVLQADHLITRANSATYADPRLVICVCRSCHYWKSVGSNRNKQEYDALVRTVLPQERVDLWDRCEQDSWRADRKYAADWKLAEAALKQELEMWRSTIEQ